MMTDQPPDTEGAAAAEKEREKEQVAGALPLEEENTTNSIVCSTRQKQKIGLLIFSILYIPLFAGAFYGFGPMQIMLEESGAFASVCNGSEENGGGGANDSNATATQQSSNDDDIICSDQTARLLTIPFIGQQMILTSPILGVLVDRYGPLALMIGLGFCGCFGVAMLLTAVSIPADNLLYVAFICIGLMASASSIMTVKTGMVFADDVVHTAVVDHDGKDDDDDDDGKDESIAPDTNQRENKNQSRVISILNTLFDAGSITYLGLWGISELGPSISNVFVGYLILAIFCFGGVIIFWVQLGSEAVPSTPPDNPDNATETGQPIEEPRSTLDTTAATTSIAQQDAGAKAASNEISDSLKIQSDEANSHNQEEPIQNDNYVLVRDRTPKEQLLSLPCIMLLVFFALNLGRNQFVLTTARDYLGSLGDEETSREYLSIFTLLMPASVLGLPFTDHVINRYGFHAGFQTICLLAAVHGLIQIFCDELNGVQIFGFVTFSFYRCFLFSIVFSYLPTLLGAHVVGKGVGAMHFAAGIFSFLNILLSNVTVKQLDGNFFVPNLLYTIVAIPCSIAAWVIGRSIQRETLAKETQAVTPQSSKVG